MKILLAGAGLCLLFFVAPQPEAMAQTAVPNGDLELESLGPWDLFGDNAVQAVVQTDVNGNGSPSWCWRRKPGTDGCNGGFLQDVYLIAGVTYQFDADVAYKCTC